MRIEDVIKKLEREKKNLRFDYLARICQDHFGNPRTKGSHQSYKKPWPSDPRITLQRGKGNKAKPYQVEQVIDALLKLQEWNEMQQKKAQEQKGEARHVTESD